MLFLRLIVLLSVCFWPVYVGTLDARLFALDAATGAVRWETRVADNAVGFALTLAPLALNGKIIVGISGAEAGVRGFIDAYDAKTGSRLWRYYVVPAPGEPGSETWGNESWRTGGGSTWLTGAYDPELNLLYWTTGNPAPDWNGDVRPADNLYTCSLLALDPDTGERRWHFQYTPHDTHDWDANQIPILVDGEFNGRQRKLVALANRNAFYYLLDRETGEFLLGKPYSKQTWAAGLDGTGRPIVLADSEPTEEGSLVLPSLQGARPTGSAPLTTHSPDSFLLPTAAWARSITRQRSSMKWERPSLAVGNRHSPVTMPQARCWHSMS
jgi:alcohol dehydrogenase (cytochrome c)